MNADNDVIIVGAPRSGTNMLRDVLTALPGFGTWPCDEINLTWRHGNRAHPSDELLGEHATARVVDYMRGEFEKARDKYGAQNIVEKTCANSLRVEFVHAVKPDARYVFITRDGLDATASAMARWNAPLDVRYTAAKTKFVPPSDLLYYGARFVANQVKKRRATATPGRTVGWWGPKVEGWQDLSRTRPLDEVCLLQWRQCVDVAQRGLDTMPSSQVFHVSYESFVREPESGLKDLLDFLGKPELFDASAVRAVSAGSVGKGRASLGEESRARLGALASDTLRSLGYDS